MVHDTIALDEIINALCLLLIIGMHDGEKNL